MHHFNQTGVWIENCWTKVRPIKKIAEPDTAHVQSTCKAQTLYVGQAAAAKGCTCL